MPLLPYEQGIMLSKKVSLIILALMEMVVMAQNLALKSRRALMHQYKMIFGLTGLVAEGLENRTEIKIEKVSAFQR